MTKPGNVNGGISTSSSQALPAASAAYRVIIWYVEGGAGVRDRTYICMKGDDDNYGWVEIANGGLIPPPHP